MPRKAYARRYAQAIFELALENNELERWQADLARLVALAGDGAILAVLDSPRIKIEEKARLLRQGLPGINPLAINLALMLIVRSSIGLISEVEREFQRLVDAHRGIQTAEVTTAIPLDDDDREKLAGRLGIITGTKVRLQHLVDPRILGGIIARVGGKLLDGSTRTKLEALRRELVGGGQVS